MPLREDILKPISEDSPSGANLYYHPSFEQIKEARREEDAGPQGEWEREIKTADYKAVVRLAEEAIATKSKDLQIAAWLT
jgi:predicted component of type VI protein secretion system